MLLTSIHIKNFRCLRDVRLSLADPTVLVGPNSAGKSSLLNALAFFFEGTRLEPEDVFAESGEPISVECTFSDLSATDRSAFGPYGLGSQMVLRTTWRDGIVHRTGRGYRFPEFATVRSQKGQAFAKAYKELREAKPDLDLPEAKVKGDVEQAMFTWEQEHPTLCEEVEDEDADSLFGFGSVGKARLLDRFQFVFVPAIRDAADDAVEKKDSLLSRLLNAVAEQRAAANEQLKTIEQTAQEQYTDAVQTSHAPVLADLSERLTTHLQRYVPSAHIALAPTPASLSIDPPAIALQGGEDNDLTDLSRQGHGFRRAFIISVLEYLADTNADDDSRDKPTLFLVIEEPELYQHPPRARHFFRTLCQLSDEQSVQVCYATHSPYFVAAGRFDSLAIFHRSEAEGGDASGSTITTASLDAVSSELPQSAKGEPRRYLERTMSARFREAFFARAVLLVEGTTDEAIFETAAELSGTSLAAEGIVCTSVGKGVLPTARAILHHLDIPVYLVFDADGSATDGEKCEACFRQKTSRTSAEASNRALLSCVGGFEEGFPATQVNPDWACFEDCIEACIPDLPSELTAVNAEEGWAGKSPEAYAEATRRVGQERLPQEIWQVLDRVRSLTQGGGQ